jgi:hypothetical protein
MGGIRIMPTQRATQPLIVSYEQLFTYVTLALSIELMLSVSMQG